MVYGALSVLGELGRAGALPWDVRVRGILQPAEETCQGAQEMIGVGALDGVSGVLATHVDPSRDVGAVGLRQGVMTANCDEIKITISGQGGHAARPHETSDPIVAAAQVINSIYLFIPRVTDSQDAVVVTFGKILGGDHANVIPEQVVLHGTVRTLDPQVRLRTFDHIRRLTSGVAATSETSIQVEHCVGTYSILNDPELVSLLRRASQDVVGLQGIEEIPRPSMGSEDFAFYLDHAPGAMFRLGCRSDRVGGAPLHSPMFDVDDEALRNGVRIMSRIAVHWFDPERRPRGQSSRSPAAAS
jgi:amidohydrolase